MYKKIKNSFDKLNLFNTIPSLFVNYTKISVYVEFYEVKLNCFEYKDKFNLWLIF